MTAEYAMALGCTPCRAGIACSSASARSASPASASALSSAPHAATSAVRPACSMASKAAAASAGRPAAVRAAMSAVNMACEGRTPAATALSYVCPDTGRMEGWCGRGRKAWVVGLDQVTVSEGQGEGG
ncbi:unnamed protein product [Closterium sp. NIES-54]